MPSRTIDLLPGESLTVADGTVVRALAAEVPSITERCLAREQAIALFGSIPAAAAAIGVSYQAVNQWPDVLPVRIADRVIAACVRRGIAVPPEALLAPEQEPVHG